MLTNFIKKALLKHIKTDTEILMKQIDNQSLANEADINALINDRKSAKIHEKAEKITKIYQNSVPKINDMYFKGDISESSAYLSYHYSYQSVYDKWVTEKKLKQKEKTKKRITTDDYVDLFNITQSAYVLNLSTFRQVSIKCELDTMLILELLDNKLLDYVFPKLLKLNEQYPTVKVFLEFIPFLDNSAIVRVRTLDKNNVDDFFKTVLKRFNEQYPIFHQFIKDNNLIIGSMIQDFSNTQDNPESVENSYIESQKDNLAIANFTYINNYNIIREEMKRGTIVGIMDLRSIFQCIHNIESVAIQKRPMPQLEKNKGHNQDLYQNISDIDSLLSLMRKKHLFVNLNKTVAKKINSTEKYISNNEREMNEIKEQLTIKLTNTR